MTNKVQTTFSADDREIIKSMLKQQKEISKIQQKLLQTGKAGQRAGKQTASGMRGANQEIGKFGGAIKGIGATLVGIVSLSQALRNEFVAMQRRQQAARIAQKTVGEAVRETRVAFTPDKTVSDKQLEPEILRVADRTRTEPQLIAAAATNAFSAKGSLENKQALNAVEQAFRILPGNLEAGETLAGRILDLIKIKPDADARQVAGFLQNIQNSSRPTSLQKVGATAVPAIFAGVGRGDTPEEAAELFAATTLITGDEEGRKSSTGLIGLFKKLGEFVPTKKGKDDRGTFKVPEEQITGFEKAEGPTEQIAALQQSPELRRQFLSKNSFESFTDNAFRAILSGEKKALKELREAQQKINPIGPGQVKLFEDKIASLEAGGFQSALTAEQKAGVNVTTQRLQEEEESDTDIVRNVIFEKTLPEIDRPFTLDSLTTLFEKSAFESGSGVFQKELGDSFQTGAKFLEKIAKGLERDGGSKSDIELAKKNASLLRELSPNEIPKKFGGKASPQNLVPPAQLPPARAIDQHPQNQQPNQPLKVEVINQPQAPAKPQVPKRRPAKALGRNGI